MPIGFIQQLTKREERNKGSSRNEIYRGTAELPGFPRPMAVVYKVPPKERASLALGNELIGARLARICGLPAPVVRICTCEKGQLLRPIPLNQQKETIFGIASIDLDPNRPAQSIDDPEMVEARVLSWDKAAMLAAIDEWLGNIDRNHRNFVWRPGREPAIIDHEDIFGGLDWRKESLVPAMRLPCMKNKVAGSIVRTQDNARMSLLIRAAKLYVEEIDLNYLGLDDIERFWCDINNRKWQEIFAYLSTRKAILSDLLFKHIKAGQLFVESS